MLDMNPNINPLYTQIADELRSKISSGEWREGQKIPTEEQLCEEFKVSRTTVRRGLEILVNEKILERRRPTGTFVRPVADRDHTLRTVNRGFTEELDEQGMDARTLLAKISISHANHEVAQHLGIQPGDEVIYLQRLRGNGQKAFVYFETWMTCRPIFSLRANDYYGSLYTMLRDKGIHMRKRFEEFEAVLPEERIQDILYVKRETAILKRTIGASSLDHTFHEFTVCYYIGSEYLYRLDYE